MMRAIVRSSLQLRRLVVAAAVGLLVFGIVQVGKTPVDALPEFEPPTVEVQTEALGLSAAEVEQLITVPLEQDLLVGVAFLDEIESVSLPGLSSVVMTFEPGTDVLDARQVVQERLTQAVGVAGLPAVAKLPQMIQPLSSTSRVSMIRLTSEQLTPIEMSVLARWVVTPRLLAVDGVANVAIWGNRERQLQVLVDPERLRENDVTLPQVVRTTGNALEVSPLSFLEASTPGTGGFIDTPNQRLNIFHEQAISTPGELAQVPVEGASGTTVGGTDRPLVLGDIADVVEDHQPLIGDTACSGGQDCLLLVVEKFPGTNTTQVAEDVDEALEALAPGLADMRLDSSTYQPASYVESSFQGLGWALLASTILLVLVVVAAFWDWRRAVIVLAGTTVSAAVSVVVLNALDTTVNLMVVCGLVLGLTAVIDDVVGDVDELATRLRWLREAQASGLRATIVETAATLRSSVLYATLIVAAVAVPLFFLSGAAGAFLPPVALAYLLAVAASMLVALTLTPALALVLLTRGRLGRRQSPALGRLRRAYDRVGPGLVGRTALAAGVFVGVAVLGLATVPFLDTAMRPALRERDVLVHFSAEPGTSLPSMTGLTEQAVEDLSALDGVREVNAEIGRAVMSDQVVDVHEGELWVVVDPDADYDAVVASIGSTVDGYPELTTDVMTYTEERVRDVLERSDEDVVVRVYGEDPEVLSAKAEEVRTAISGVEGVRRAQVETMPQEPTLEVQVDLDRAQALGIKPGDVRRAAASLLGGITVGNLFEEQKVFDVVVWGAPQIRETQADLANLLIDTPDGRTIRLDDVAEVSAVPNDALIAHESVARYLQVTGDVAGRDVADATSDVEAALDEVTFPLDHHAEVIAGYAAQQDARGRLLSIGAACAIGVFLLLQAAFRSWRLAAAVFVALPVTLAGSVLATLIFGGEVTLGSVAGYLAVVGLAARGAVKLVRHFQHLQRHEAVPFGADLVVRGTGERLAPILTSALATAAMLLPFAVVGSATGFELLQPAAVAVLGGLLTTTVVTLLVLPVAFLRLGSGPDADSWADDLLSTPSRPEEDTVVST